MASGRAIAKTTTTTTTTRIPLVSSRDLSRKDQEDEEMRPNSQGDDDAEMVQVLELSMRKNRNKRETFRAEVEKEHKKRIEKARSRISSIYDDHNSQVAQIRKAQIEKLAQLLKKKMSIEASIMASINSLEMAYDACAHELQVVIRGRADELG
ncbi:hypothetical protein BJ546DRAFT_1067508 [Cryomyces antarcticus]